MTTDLDDRLTDLLVRSAAAVDVRPDLDAIRAEDGAQPLVDLGRRPRDVRRLLALAAAVVLVLGLVGAAALVTRDDTTPVAQLPLTAEDRFPVLGHVPADLEDAHVEANEGEGNHQSGLESTYASESTVARAALGVVAADGSISDLIQLAAADEGGAAGGRPPSSGLVEDVGDGYLIRQESSQVWLTGPDRSVTAVGGPQAAEVVRSLVEPLKASRDPRQVLRGLIAPPGFEVVAEPTLREAEKAEIAAPTGPPCSAPTPSDCDTPPTMVLVETGVGAPALGVMSAGGTVVPVDIGGQAGLMSNHAELTKIAWTAPNGVTLSLLAEYGEDEALAIARGIELVDEATWRDTYPEWPDDSVDQGPATTGTTEVVTGSGIVGQPAPPLPGRSTDDEEVTYADHWTVVVMGPADCTESGCADLELDALVGVVAAPGHPGVPAEPLLQLVAVVDAPSADTLADDAQAVGFDGAAIVGSATDLVQSWQLDALPAFAVVDPDGIVTSVEAGGPVTTEAIVRALVAGTGAADTTTTSPEPTGDTAPTETTDPDTDSDVGAEDEAEAEAEDEAEIDAAFHTAFDTSLSEEERFAAVEDGPGLLAAGREAAASYPQAAESISVTVHSIDVVAPDRATVVFELLYDGARLLGRRTGEAVLIDGAWKVGRETRCALIREAGVGCP